MGQHDGIDPRRINRERRPIAGAQLLGSLKKSAVHQHSMLSEIEKMFRAGHGAGGSKECECGHRMTILDGMKSAVFADLAAVGAAVCTQYNIPTS